MPEGTKGFVTDAPMTGDTFEVGATATVDAGPLGEVELKGTVSKSGADAPLTYCLSGAVESAGPPVAVEGGTLEVCKDASGKVTAKLAGTLVLDGNKGKANCAVTLGAAGGMDCTLETLTLLGVETSGAVLGWSNGAKSVAVSAAKASLDYLGQQVAVTLSGVLIPGQDTSLDLAVDDPTAVAMLGDWAQAAAASGGGTIARSAAVVTTSLQLGAAAVALAGPGASAKAADFEVDASRIGGGTWAVALQVGSLAASPLQVAALKGKADEGDAAACATGTLQAKAPGTDAAVQATLCFAAGKTPSVTLSAAADVAPVGAVAVDGAFEAGSTEVCLQGTSSKSMPGLAGAAAAPIAVSLCLDLTAMSFGPATLSATVQLGGLGAVEVSGSASDGALCLAGTGGVAIAGKPLALKATACTDAGFAALQAKASASLDLPPFGAVQAEAVLDGAPGSLCFAAKVPAKLAFVASDVELVAEQCMTLAKDDAGTNQATLQQGPVVTMKLTHATLGTFTLQGVWDGEAQGSGGSKGVLCVSGSLPAKATALLPLPGATILGARGTTCYGKDGFEGLEVASIFRIGEASSPAAVWLQAKGGLEADGGACVAKATSQADCALLEAGWKASQDDPAATEDRRFDWVGGSCFDLQPDDAAACKVAGGSWNNDVAGKLELGLAPFCQKAGATSCGWAESCDVAAGDAVCAQVWQPFAALKSAPVDVQGVGLAALEGVVLAGKDTASLSLRAAATFGGGQGTLPLLKSGGTTLLALEKLGVVARVDDKGGYSVGLRGEALFDLGAAGMPAWSVRALLHSELDDAGASFFGRVLPSSCSGPSCTFPSFEPFADLVGKGAFAVQAKGAELSFGLGWAAGAEAGLTLAMRTAGTVELLGNAKAEVVVAARAHWPKGQGGKPTLSLAAILQSFVVQAGALKLELGKVKADGGVAVKPIVLLASSEKVAAMPIDTDGDFGNGPEVTWEIPKGLTLRTEAEIAHVADLFETTTAKLDLTFAGTSQFHIRGEIATVWPLIQPSFGIPTLHSASLKTVFVDLDVASTVVLKIGGTAEVVTLDRKGGKHQLTGLCEFEVDSTSSIGGTMALTGLWQEPFFIPNLAVMDMGVSIKLQPAVPPVPTAFGFTGTGLLHKAEIDAPWPAITKDAQNNPVGQNADGTPMAQLPPQVLSIGNSFYLDTAPTPSGFCFAGTCAPMPPLLIRIDRQNLSTDDLIWAIGQMQKGVATLVEKTQSMQILDPKTGKPTAGKAPFAAITDALPLDKALAFQVPANVKLDLHRALVYLSTHEQSRFGLDWPFGFRLELDAEMKVPAGKEAGKSKKLRVQGELDASGMSLHGRMSPLQVVEGLEIAADPYRRVGKLAGGSLSLPAKLAAASARTVTLAVRGPAVGGATLIDTSAAPARVRLFETKELFPACDAGAALQPTAPDGSAIDCSKKVPALALSISQAGSGPRTVRTARGVRLPDVWQRVGYSVSDAGRVRLYVDGRGVPTVDSADGADGVAGTSDDLPRLPPPAIAATTTVGGAGLDAVDALRFWKTVRTSAQISRHLYALPKGAHNDADLLGWYEFDYDLAAENGGSAALHDSHAAGRHGSYVGGAASILDSADQDLRVDLELPLLDPTASGMGFAAGVALPLPAPLAALLGAPNLQVAARLFASKTKLEGRLYTRSLTVLPIPSLGGFVLSGDGPNGKAGDHDDGLFFEASFSPGLDTSSAHLPTVDASARLALDWKSKRYPIGSVTTRIGCLAKDGKGGAAFTGKPCKLGAGYHLFAKTNVGADGTLTLPLGGTDSLGITGSFLATTLDAPVRIEADAGMAAFGRTLAKQKLTIDGKGISATGALDLGAIAGVEFGTAVSLGITFTWAPARLCGVGKTAVEVPQFATFDGSVEACFGHQPYAKFSGTAKAGSLGATNIPVTDVAVSLDSSKGLLVNKARLQVPSLFDGNVKGAFKTPTSFAVTGTSTVAPGAGKLLRWQSTATVSRSGSSGGASLSSKIDTSASGGWASGTIAGSFISGGGKYYWALGGNATLAPAGFKLASGRFWACAPASKNSPGIPAECKNPSNWGVGAQGVVDLGVAKVAMLGKAAFGLKSGSTTYDHLVMTGQLKTTLFSRFGLDMAVTQQLSWPSISGKTGMTLDGKMSIFGIAPTMSAKLTAGADGRPSQVSLTAKGTLKPYSALSLANGSATYTWKPTGASASASGKVTISGVLSGNVSTNISSNGSYSFKGTTNVSVAKLMSLKTGITLNGTGAYVNATMTADTKDVDLSGAIKGTIPYAGNYSFAGSGGLKLGAFPTASVGNFKSHYSSGISGTGAVDIKVVKMSVAASAGRNGTGLTVSGNQTYDWTIGNFNFPYVTESVKYVADAISGWSCSTYCHTKDPVWGNCILVWFKCTKKTTHNDYKKVGATVKFNLSGTSYVSSSTVKLGATATLNVGPVKGSSSTTCGIGTNPQCCFSFPSPVGKQCLKLY